MMRRVRSGLHCVCLCVVVTATAALSCAPALEGTGSVPPPGKLPNGGSVVEPAAPRVPWSEKSRVQRMEYMGLVFYPKMRELFRGEDAQAYAHFRCQTCHGEDMVAADYRMPNGLHPLPAISPLEAALAHDEKTARFMTDRVVPALRELLGTGNPPAAGDSDSVACHACHATGDAPPSVVSGTTPGL
jgi:hypothetical protein